MTLLEAILPHFKAKKRRWRRRLCRLLGHKPDFKGSSTPVCWSRKPGEPLPDGLDTRTRSEWGCLWCRCGLPTTYSRD